MTPLADTRVVTIALNLPGPLAAHVLSGLGAQVTKIEPPAGDPMQAHDPGWYRELCAGQHIERLDLKSPAGRERLEQLLAGADLLLTSQRPAALERLGLDRGNLAARHPQLCVVHIVGRVGRAEAPGHDLTYQAALGLVAPPQMPRTLLADIAGAQQAVQTALGLLLARARGQGAGQEEVGLEDTAAVFAEPWRRGATRPGAVLGGGLPCYALYHTADGWIAVGALEPHFRKRLGAALGVSEDDAEAMRARFLAQPAVYWTTLAREHDLPIVALPES